MFDIDLVRYVLEKKVSDNKISFFSFYEPLENTEQIVRYQENIQYILGEQNGLNDNNAFAILRPSSMEITNLKSNYISSFGLELNVKTYAKYRDLMVNKFKKVITREINGNKFDLVVDENGFVNIYEEFDIENPQPNKFVGFEKDFGIYTHEYLKANLQTITDEFNTFITQMYHNLDLKAFKTHILVHEKYLYKFDTTLRYLGEVELYKADFNFSAFECDTPTTLNGDDIINITCTGNCTIADYKVELGNDLSRFIINGIECEPLGLDSAYQSGSVGSQFNYVENKIITGIANSFTYSFVVEKGNEIIQELYKIARYGNSTPNKIYTLVEEFTSYGITTTKTYKCKLAKCLSNTNNGDIMVITTDFLVGEY